MACSKMSSDSGPGSRGWSSSPESFSSLLTLRKEGAGRVLNHVLLKQLRTSNLRTQQAWPAMLAHRQGGWPLAGVPSISNIGASQS